MFQLYHNQSATNSQQLKIHIINYVSSKENCWSTIHPSIPCGCFHSCFFVEMFEMKIELMPIFKREQKKMRKANAIFIHDVE